MKITEFRKHYTMYNHMSDQEVADRLYREYYSDMSRPEFDLRFLGIYTARVNETGHLVKFKWHDGQPRKVPTGEHPIEGLPHCQ